MDITGANGLYQARRLDEAQAAYSSLLTGPDSAAASYGLGLIAMARKNDRDALAHLQRSMKIRPSAAAAYYAGNCYENAGNLTAASMSYLDATRLDPAMRIAAQALTRLAAADDGVAPSTADRVSSVAAEIAGGLPPTPGRIMSDSRPLRAYLPLLRPAAALALVWLALHIVAASVALDSGSRAALASVERYAGMALPWLAVLVIAYAAASCLTTRYIVTDHRIEVRKGVASRYQQVLWLWQINTPVEFRQTLAQRILNTGEILVQSTHDPSTPPGAPTGDAGTLSIAGIANARKMRELAEYLRVTALRERREMLANFVGR
jgi:hypothetical protein